MSSGSQAAPSGAVFAIEPDAAEWSREKEAQRHGSLGTGTARLYVNVYLVDQAYGGAEEGGWWYDYGLPVESRLAQTEDEAKAMLAELQARWEVKNQGRPEIYSVLSEGRYRVRREGSFAEIWPNPAPHYE